MSACEKWPNGDVGVFLDPPYGEGSMDYAGGGNTSGDIAADVWAWACDSWRPPGASRAEVRICVAGYEDGRTVPDGWVTVEWDANVSARGAGYGNHGASGEAKANARRERLWFSPNCLRPDVGQMGLAL